MTVEQSWNKASFWSENWLGLCLVGMMSIFIAVMFYMMTRPNQSAREAALEAIILTAASIVASFLITKLYAEMSYNKSLRDHGVQIASGIMVLKRQMEGLTDWIGQKRASLSDIGGGGESSEAILEHVEQTLLGFKGMTDTALGGIAGVIGDAFAQYEAVMEQVSTVRLEAFQRTSRIQEEMQKAASNEEMVKLQTQIQEIGIQTEKQIAKLARTSALPIPNLPPTRTYSAACPYCSESTLIEIVDKKGETQVVACGYCGKAFNAHVTASQSITTRATASELRHQFSEKTDFETLGILTRNDWWVPVEQVLQLIPLVLAYDSKLQQDGKARTPYNLQSLLIADEGKMLDSKISNSTVRRFLRMVYHGRGFMFRPDQQILFKSIYINELSEESVLKAFIRASVTRIASWKTIDMKDLPDLNKLLLGDRPGGEKLLLDALKHVQRGTFRLPIDFTKL